MLLIDPEPANQLMISSLLSGLGYRVTIAGNGAGALKTLDGGAHFTIVLLACDQPSADSYEFAKQLRNRERIGAPRIPVIAICATADIQHIQRCLQSGMDGILRKPISEQSLIQTMQLWCKNTLQPAAAPTSAQLELQQLFLSTLPADHKALNAALAGADAASATRYAHRIKGAALTVGNQPIAQSLAALEQELREQGLSNSAALQNKLAAANRDIETLLQVQAVTAGQQR